MIEEIETRRKPEPKHEPTEAERQTARETLAYLEALPWRPFTEEW